MVNFLIKGCICYRCVKLDLLMLKYLLPLHTYYTHFDEILSWGSGGPGRLYTVLARGRCRIGVAGRSEYEISKKLMLIEIGFKLWPSFSDTHTRKHCLIYINTDYITLYTVPRRST